MDAVIINSRVRGPIATNLGGEPGMTFIPKLLVTGVATIVVSSALILWSALSFRSFFFAFVFIPLCIWNAIAYYIRAVGRHRPRYLRSTAGQCSSGKPDDRSHWSGPEILAEMAIFGCPLLWLFEADTTFSIQVTVGYLTEFFTGWRTRAEP